MTLILRSTDLTTFGTNTSISTSGDDFFLRPGVLLASTGGIGINVSVTDVTLRIDGMIVAAFAGIDSSSAAGLRVAVGVSGLVSSLESGSGSFGVAMRGGSGSLVNHGQISAPEAIAVFLRDGSNTVQNYGSITGATGVQLYFVGSGDQLYNAGVIAGNGGFDGARDPFEGTGVYVQSSLSTIINAAGGRILSTAAEGPAITVGEQASALRIRNEGEITSASGIAVDASLLGLDANGTNLFNSGTITGQDGSFRGSASGDSAVNRGIMSGDVDMGSGGDFFENRGGIVNGLWNGGEGADFYSAGGNSRVNGGIYGSVGNDTLLGGDNEDGMFGGADNDSLRGRAGEDFLQGDDGNDLIYGGDDDDEVYGGNQNDTLYGGAGEDTLDGGSNEDLIYGGADADSLTGGGSVDKLYGGLGDDTLDGGTNNDTVSGGAGDDVLLGNTGNDSLYGGWGRDTMTGGTGLDVFFFNTRPDGNYDEITDFIVADDTIRLDDAAFAGLATGALAAAFAANTSGLATTAAHRIVYETDTGALFFDADGNGAGARVQFAALDAGLALTAADFFVY